MEFPPNLSASEPISHYKTLFSLCSKQGFFIGYLGSTKRISRQRNKGKTQSSRTEHNCLLLSEIAQH